MYYLASLASFDIATEVHVRSLQTQVINVCVIVYVPTHSNFNQIIVLCRATTTLYNQAHVACGP